MFDAIFRKVIGFFGWGLVKMLGSMAFGLAVYCERGWAAWLAWNWLVPPLYPQMPVLSWVQATAAVAVLSIFRSYVDASDALWMRELQRRSQTTEEFFLARVYSVTIPVACVAQAWLLRLILV